MVIMVPLQDTLLLMGLDDEYAEAREWVAHSMVVHQVRPGRGCCWCFANYDMVQP